MERTSQGTLVLSPSDLTGFLACEHLTALAPGRGRRAPEPKVDNPQFDLITRKGDEHERGLPRAAPRGRARRSSRSASTRRLGRGRSSATDRGDARRRRRRLPGASSSTGAGAGSPTSCRSRPVELGVELRGGRHEARPARQACLHPPALLLHRAARADPGPSRREQMHVVLGSGERESFRPEEFGAYYRRVRGRLERFVADPPATEPWPVDALRHLRLQAALRRALGRGRPPLRVAGHPPRADRAARRRRHRDARRARARARPSRRPRIAGRDLREASASRPSSSSAARETGARQLRACSSRSRAPASRCCPSPSPGDLFFDFEGNPFWDSTGGLEYLWGILDVERDFTPLHAHDHDERARAFEPFIDFVHERLDAAPRHARLPLRAVRDHRAQAADGPVRHARGRSSTTCCAAGCSSTCCASCGTARASRPGYGLKELETFLDFERDAEVKDGGTSIVVFEQWMQTRDDALLAADRRRTTARTASRRCCCATGCWSCATRRSSSSGRSRTRSRRQSRERRRRGRWSVPRCGERLLDAGERVGRAAPRLPPPRAQAGLVGVLRPRGDDAGRAARGRRLDRRPRAASASREPVKRSIAYTFTFPAQQHKIGQGQDVDRSGDGRVAPATMLELDREARGRPASAGRSSTTCRCRQALIPGGPYRHAGAGGRARALRPRRCSRATPLPGARVDPAPRARSTETSRRATSTS